MKEKEKERMKVQLQRKGKNPDFSIVSKAKLFQRKLELLVGEVLNSSWKEKNDKTNRDRKKLIRMLKDIYDRIAKTFFKKYSFLIFDHLKT